MLICMCPDDDGCPAAGSDCFCFPWCEYLKEEGVNNGNTGRIDECGNCVEETLQKH